MVNQFEIAWVWVVCLVAVFSGLGLLGCRVGHRSPRSVRRSLGYSIFGLMLLSLAATTVGLLVMQDSFWIVAGSGLMTTVVCSTLDNGSARKGEAHMAAF